MKDLIKSIKITFSFCVLFGVTYVFVLWAVAQFLGPNKGNADLVMLNGKVVGAANVGQNFTKDIYFWGRPSSAGTGYDAANSCGSNKGPSNEEYLQTIKARIDTFLVHHPYLKRNEIPAEMVTASGSGLDPDITPECAYVQVKRIAWARGMNISKVKELVDSSIQKPLLGMFGTQRVNVLKLNVALDGNYK